MPTPTDAIPSPALQVSLPGYPTRYPIEIQSGLLGRLEALLRAHCPTPRRALVITDPTVGPLYLETVLSGFRAAGWRVDGLTLPVGGEAAKSLAVATEVYQRAMALGVKRADLLVALGGGVVGDLVGYCAATYYRGTQFLQIPTTLLAQVDSSVGGKVAINFQTVKNGIGTFHQPAAVWMDPHVLSTLPEREVRAGLAEVVKTALLETTATGHHGFWAALRAAFGHEAMPTDWVPLLTRCCAIKAAVVAQDERELTGVRAILNLGHTFAHALEAATHYQALLHGEAVALGLRLAFRLSAQRGLIAAADATEVEAFCDQLGLLRDCPPGLNPDSLVALMRQDKKNVTDRIRLVLPVGPLGQVQVVEDIPEADVSGLWAKALDAQ